MRKTSGIYALILIVMLVSSCSKDKKDPPTVTTADVTDITFTTAVSGGNVLSDGGDSVIARGVCWSKLTAPSTDDNRTQESGTLGTFTSILSQLAPYTKYYIRAYATNASGTGYGNEISFSTFKTAVPELITTEIISIGQKSAVSGGSVTADNGSSVVVRGVCWSIAPNPTISDNKSSSGSGSGDFSGFISGLAVHTTYYVRAYATNRLGTGYGNELIFTTLDYGTITDNDNNSYKTILIGSQEWMAENLKTLTYNNGDSIPYVAIDTVWNILSEGAYCWYDNSEVDYKDTYGALYNWFAVSGDRNICPQGWHVPNDEDWTMLTDYLIAGGFGYGGNGEYIAKSLADTSGWTTNSTPGTIGNDQSANNSSGFSALPGGVRIRSGAYDLAGYTCSFWSSSEHYTGYGNALTLSGEFFNIYRGYTFNQSGASVRCLKDFQP